MGLRFQVQAVKIVNRGGGLKDTRMGDVSDGKIRFERTRESGSDYVVFVCPSCKSRGKPGRQKRCLYDVTAMMSDKSLLFMCNQPGCDAELEVSRPKTAVETPKLIMSPSEYKQKQNRGPVELARG